MDATKLNRGALDRAHQVLVLEYVAFQRQRPATVGADLGGHALGIGQLQVGDRHRRAMGGQHQRTGAADAVAATGNDGHFTAEIKLRIRIHEHHSCWLHAPDC